MQIIKDKKILLQVIVDAVRNSEDRPESFRLYERREGDFLEHPGLPEGSVRIDSRLIRALENEGTLALRQGSSPQICLVDLISTDQPNAPTEKAEIVTRKARAPDMFESAFTVYSVTGVLGEGGSGRVFAVKDADRRAFALKCLFPDRVNTERRKRFKNEMDFCRKFRHENIIQVTDFGLAEWDNRECPFYVMPQYPKTLRTLIDGGLSPDRVLSLFSQILDGVEAAHLLSVIHRDIKPENILYDPEKNLLIVADFGIAHFEEDIIATAVDTKPNAKMANLAYSAPEQRAKGVAVDHRADIFALGLILNEMFTRTVPQGAGFTTIAAIAPQFSYLDPLVEKMIQHSCGARFGNIKEIKTELIGRRVEFIAFQELDAKRREVVPASNAALFEPVQLVGVVDWRKGNLVFQLNQSPDIRWINRFLSPREPYTSITGAGPNHFDFQDDKALVPAEVHTAQDIVNYFKRYLEMANRAYQQDLEIQAAQRDKELREKLEREVEEAETKARILKNVKI